MWNKFEDTLKISKCSKKSKNFCILDNPSIDNSKIINAYGLFDKVFLKENKWVDCIEEKSKQEKAEEMAQQLRETSALLEDPGPIPSTLWVPHNHW